MLAPGGKKMLNFYILDILKAHSDENHRLTQQQIISYLRVEYGMECERKAVARNISALMEYGIDIENDGGYYLASRAFEDSELRLLIDSVYFSRQIPAGQARALIEKLQGFGGPGFGKTLHHVVGLPALHNRENKQFFYTLQTLDDAIGQKKKVSLMVNAYGADKKMHPRREQKYIVNPYQLVAANGHYYLVGNHNNHDNVAHIRVDRVTDCEMLPEKAKPMQLVKGLEAGLNLPKYMAENIYMSIGEAETTRFRIPNYYMNEVMDWFGPDVKVEQGGTNAQGEETLVITAKVNQSAMFHWALQYLQAVEVLEPEGLRAGIAKSINAARNQYMHEA